MARRIPLCLPLSPAGSFERSREMMRLKVRKGDYESIRDSLDREFSYMVFRRETTTKDGEDFRDVIKILGEMGIKTGALEIYQEHGTDRLYLKAKLMHSHIEVGTQEILGSVLPKDTSCWYYGKKTAE